MKGNKDSLILMIKKRIKNTKTDKSNKDTLEKQLLKKKIPKVQVSKIISNVMTLELLDEAYLFAISDAINESGEHNNIDLSKYFTDVEINKYGKWKYQDNDIQLSFPNTIQFQGTDEQFITFMTAQELMTYFEKGMFNYNFDTQREAKIKIVNDQIYKSININKNAIKEISNLIIERQFIPNFITLNILKTGDEEIVYNEADQILEIKSGSIDILDGMHRTLAIYNAIKKRPDTNISFGVLITNFDLQKARRYIVQEDKKNKISKEHIKNFNDDLSKIIMDGIKSKSKDFKSIVAENTLSKKMNPNSVMTEAEFRGYLDGVFRVKTSREAHKVSDVISPQLDNLYGYIDEKKINKQKILGRIYMIHFLTLFKIKKNKMATDQEIEKTISIANDVKTLKTRDIHIVETQMINNFKI